MLLAAAEILMGSRQRLHKALQDLTTEQWLMQPEGFANNIAWNVGHLIVAQQGLIYGRLNVEGYDLGNMPAMYRPGTSPADWDTAPDTDELLQLFLEIPSKLAGDIEAGKFDNYVAPEPVEGRFPPPATAMHALIFNQYHEGVHTGNIGDLLAFVKKD